MMAFSPPKADGDNSSLDGNGGVGEDMYSMFAEGSVELEKGGSSLGGSESDSRGSSGDPEIGSSRSGDSYTSGSSSSGSHSFTGSSSDYTESSSGSDRQDEEDSAGSEDDRDEGDEDIMNGSAGVGVRFDHNANDEHHDRHGTREHGNDHEINSQHHLPSSAMTNMRDSPPRQRQTHFEILEKYMQKDIKSPTKIALIARALKFREHSRPVHVDYSEPEIPIDTSLPAFTSMSHPNREHIRGHLRAHKEVVETAIPRVDTQPPKALVWSAQKTISRLRDPLPSLDVPMTIKFHRGYNALDHIQRQHHFHDNLVRKAKSRIETRHNLHHVKMHMIREKRRLRQAAQAKRRSKIRAERRRKITGTGGITDRGWILKSELTSPMRLPSRNMTGLRESRALTSMMDMDVEGMHHEGGEEQIYDPRHFGAHMRHMPRGEQGRSRRSRRRRRRNVRSRDNSMWQQPSIGSLSSMAENSGLFHFPPIFSSNSAPQLFPPSTRQATASQYGSREASVVSTAMMPNTAGTYSNPSSRESRDQFPGPDDPTNLVTAEATFTA